MGLPLYVNCEMRIKLSSPHYEVKRLLAFIVSMKHHKESGLPNSDIFYFFHAHYQFPMNVIIRSLIGALLFVMLPHCAMHCPHTIHYSQISSKKELFSPQTTKILFTQENPLGYDLSSLLTKTFIRNVWTILYIGWIS